MAAQGDPRVLFVMNLVLSTLFAGAVVWGLGFIDVLSFSWRSVALLAAALMFLTYLVTH
jgi:hypothetical protein